MKNVKRITKMACMAITMLLLGNSGFAQLQVSNGGTYYVCQGVAEPLTLDDPNEFVNEPQDWEWGSSSNECNSSSCTFSNGYTVSGFGYVNACSPTSYPNFIYATVTANTASPITVSVVERACSDPDNNTTITFTLVPYYTSITGNADFCSSGNETYTASTNLNVGTNGWTWTAPSFLTGSSTTNQVTYTPTNTTTASGTITASVVVGCPSNSPSNTASLNVTSYPSTLKAPGNPLNYSEANNTCYYNASVLPVTNAEYYEWADNSSFSAGSLYCVNTTSPTSTEAPFFTETNYTIYVRTLNPCATGPYSVYTKETPTAPGNCLAVVYKSNNTALNELASIAYKMYPSPASSQITIEYPANPDNSAISLSVYTMLGQKLISWTLPPADGIATENIAGLPAGLYVYSITSGNDIVNRGKLMIQR